MIRVLLVDDHAMIREGIKRLLEFNGTMKVVGEAGNGEEALEFLEKETTDIVLLDINMPKMNGIDCLTRIRKDYEKTKVLMLTVHNDAEYLLKAIDIGANGYILKDSSSDELVQAIEMILAGEQYIQPDLIPVLNQSLVRRDEQKAVLENLTKREIEVLIMVAEGDFNKDIAARMGISERTVKNHISNIFKKIDVADRTQAAVFAIKNNLISL